MSEQKTVPTLYEWAGGSPALERLFVRFYERVPQEPLLRDVFAQMDPHHAQHVAAFVGEVLGGPKVYSEEHGGHAHMIRKHMGRNLTDEQRRRWMSLLLETADEVGLPDDPEFRSAFVGYLEWGSRLAVINSKLDLAATEDTTAPMPQWSWGAVGGPYQG
ncbi:globin [Terriglobus albidus]|uniref:Globin n=1 Tax=Terriglobus albidus TaxID=1592106 RepID=A0A5B9E6R1_9BACT|nr:group II truncated hemoglobin [Terriglobus albidus]QEE26775.1 globin [Terriglobus albidus]